MDPLFPPNKDLDNTRKFDYYSCRARSRPAKKRRFAGTINGEIIRKKNRLYTVSIDTHFSASHRLIGYSGPCESLHGHTWKVRVTVRAEQLDEIGITVDFKTLNTIIQSVVQKLDHHHINDISPFDTINPTAENLACYLYRTIKEKMPGSVTMSEVIVWESDRYAVSYSE